MERVFFNAVMHNLSLLMKIYVLGTYMNIYMYKFLHIWELIFFNMRACNQGATSNYMYSRLISSRDIKLGYWTLMQLTNSIGAMSSSQSVGLWLSVGWWRTSHCRQQWWRTYHTSNGGAGAKCIDLASVAPMVVVNDHMAGRERKGMVQ
jgi:hypothetical protein